VLVDSRPAELVLDSITVVVGDAGVESIGIGGGERRGAPALLGEALRQLAEFLDGRRRAFDLPLAPRGTPFQRAVWAATATVPYGATWSYRDVAVAIGSSRSVRAVGGALRANPLLLVVPCHRIVGADGSLTGFAAGLEVKRWLLALEARCVTDLR
jgi:methylated-DNA-[protein]-cysteine S-methyltransferase